jgi:hypothetical protein
VVSEFDKKINKVFPSLDEIFRSSDNMRHKESSSKPLDDLQFIDKVLDTGSKRMVRYLDSSPLFPVSPQPKPERSVHFDPLSDVRDPKSVLPKNVKENLSSSISHRRDNFPAPTSTRSPAPLFYPDVAYFPSSAIYSSSVPSAPPLPAVNPAYSTPSVSPPSYVKNVLVTSSSHSYSGVPFPTAPEGNAIRFLRNQQPKPHEMLESLPHSVESSRPLQYHQQSPRLINEMTFPQPPGSSADIYQKQHYLTKLKVMRERMATNYNK